MEVSEREAGPAEEVSEAALRVEEWAENFRSSQRIRHESLERPEDAGKDDRSRFKAATVVIFSVLFLAVLLVTAALKLIL